MVTDKITSGKHNSRETQGDRRDGEKTSVNPVVQEKVGKLKGEEEGSVPSCFLMSGARYKADKEVSRERKG